MSNKNIVIVGLFVAGFIAILAYFFRPASTQSTTTIKSTSPDSTQERPRSSSVSAPSNEALQKYFEARKTGRNLVDETKAIQRFVDSLTSEQAFAAAEPLLDYADEALVAAYADANARRNSADGFMTVLRLLDHDHERRIASGLRIMFSGRVTNETIRTINEGLQASNYGLSESQQSFILDLVENRATNDVVDMLSKHRSRFTSYPDRVDRIVSEIGIANTRR